MRRFFLSFIFGLMCCCGINAQEFAELDPEYDDSEPLKSAKGDVKYYVIRIDGSVLYAQKQFIFLDKSIQEDAHNFARNKSLRWAFVKTEDGIAIYSPGNGSIMARKPDYNYPGVRAYVTSGIFELEDYSYTPEEGISAMFGDKKMYLGVDEKQSILIWKDHPSCNIRIIPLEMELERQKSKLRTVELLSYERVDEPKTAEELAAEAKKAEEMRQQREPDPQGALAMVHRILDKVKTKHSSWISQSGGTFTIKFKYYQPGTGNHFPLNLYGGSLAYGSPTEGYPNTPSYESSIAINTQSFTIRTKDNDIMLSGNLDKRGNDVKPGDPFTDVWGCKGGTYAIKEAQFELPSHMFVKLDGTISCSHSHRTISRSASTSEQFNTYTNRMGKTIKVAGMTDYYPGHCFNHSQTTTFAMDKLIMSGGMEKDKMINMMLQGGVVIAGQTNKNLGTFVLDTRTKECLVYALWNLYGFNDQKFLDTYVNLNDASYKALDRKQEILQGLLSITNVIESPDEEYKEFGSYQREATSLAQEMINRGEVVPALNFIYDVSDVYYRFGLGGAATTFINQAYKILLARRQQLYNDFPNEERKLLMKTACLTWKSSILEDFSSQKVKITDTKTPNKVDEGNYNRSLNGVAGRLTEREEALKYLHACDVAALENLMTNYDALNAAVMVCKMKNYVEEVKRKGIVISEEWLNYLLSYRAINTVYPDLLKYTEEQLKKEAEW